MEDQNKTPNSGQGNVLQFPNRKVAAAAAPVKKERIPKLPIGNQATAVEMSKSKKVAAASVLAIMLMTVAVNKYTFNSKSESADLTSTSSQSMGRQIASVGQLNWTRDASWEMQLADKLASPQARQIASTSVGRSATTEEKLRWGILEEKYTIAYKEDNHAIHSILLQDPIGKPSYILDRNKFLSEYGHLFEHSFDTAKLKSVEKSDDKTVESYTLFDKDNNAKGEARFELDRHKRLISLKVEPVQI